ncbi:hypothetical protein VE03_10323 [Pseudogymnoascus sp. 23342-1-I1]|nr:hypothetical protein VE03_10323 [Pseudogymnoascus sp. 23342-1-I1]
MGIWGPDYVTNANGDVELEVARIVIRMGWHLQGRPTTVDVETNDSAFNLGYDNDVTGYAQGVLTETQGA